MQRLACENVFWTSQGIHLPYRLLRDMGIRDNSICWGHWVYSSRKADAKASPDAGKPSAWGRADTSRAQLVLTPLPPEAWPTAFRLDIQLRERAGSLAKAAAVIDELGLNIVAAECAPAGFMHGTWSVICEVAKLSHKVFHHTRSLRHVLSPERFKLLPKTMPGIPNPESSREWQAVTEALWEDMAFSIVSRTFVKMHEVGWILRLVHHRCARDGSSLAQDIESVRAIAREYLRNRRLLQAHIVLLKKLLDGGTPDAADGFLPKPNEDGFLDHRFLYGRGLFLLKHADISRDQPFELFSEAKRYYTPDDECDPPRSTLKRILNGITHDGLDEFFKDHEHCLSAIIDRTGTLIETDPRSSDAMLGQIAKVLHYEGTRVTCRAVDGRLMTHLLHLWTRSRGDLAVIREYRYSQASEVMALSNRSLETDLPFSGELKLPCRVTCSINNSQRTIRFFPISEPYSAGAMRIRLQYQVHFDSGRRKRARAPDAPGAAGPEHTSSAPPPSSEQAAHSTRTTAGMIAKLSQALAGAGLSVISLHNQVRDRPRHQFSTSRPRDAGTVEFYGIAESDTPAEHQPADPPPCLETVRKAFDRCLAELKVDYQAQHASLRIVDYWVRREVTSQLFISTRFNDFWMRHGDRIQQVCLAHGLKPIFVKDPQSLTNNVMEKIREANAMLQILPLLESDPELEQINLGWLHGEYMSALLLEMPVARAVQVDRKTTSADWLKVLKVKTEQDYKKFADVEDLCTAVLPEILTWVRRQLEERK